MLSQDTRHLQQNTDPDDTEDEDCIITHIRPAVHRHHPYRRPEPQQVGVTPVRRVVSLDAEPSGLPESAPVQQPAPAPHSLPDQRPSLMQSPSHGDTPPAILYSLKSLVFQALLAAPAGEWLSARDVADYIKDKCPQLFEARGERVCRSGAYRVMRSNTQFLERSAGGRDTILNPNRWRLAEGARDTAILLAWRTTQSAGRPPASPQPSGRAFSDIPYTHKAMTLQALLAAPEGRWLHSSELTDYINAQYPQLLQEKGIRRVRARTTGVLAEIGDLSEKYVPENGKLSPVYWRLAPGAREEATRLAWREREH